MAAKKDRPRVALVIGSGSVKCTAAIGLKKVLEREKIDMDNVFECGEQAARKQLLHIKKLLESSE